MALATIPPEVAVVGLGYVGLPLACRFGLHYSTLGFDIDEKRIAELQRGHDRNGELTRADLERPPLHFSSEEETLRKADFFVVAVPTPVDHLKQPDLRALEQATAMIGRALRRRVEGIGPSAGPATVVFESTVYPGCTEDVCVPILERESGLRGGPDFKVGYSPERVNPGDPAHGLDKVVKIVSAEDEETLDLLADVYGPVTGHQIYRAPSIRVAEAAKVIENVQRDVNIAIANEFAMIFHRLGLDTGAILDAAATKWNFLGFRPGLVGGHCIPVDPYYLADLAQRAGYQPEVILAGRKVNDSIGDFIGREAARLVAEGRGSTEGAQAVVLGCAFKEDVRDSRNTGVTGLVQALELHGLEVDVYDPVLSPSQIRDERLKAIDDPFSASTTYDLVILAVPHKVLMDQPIEHYLSLLRDSQGGVFVDVKGAMTKFRNRIAEGGVVYWCL